MNEYLMYIAERIKPKDLNQEFKYLSIKNISLPTLEVETHQTLPQGVAVKPVHWFTKEEVLNAQKQLKQKEWVSFEESGVPLVGSVLEAWFDDGRCCWHKAHVVGYHPSEANTLAVSLIGDQESRLIWSDTSGIRPILSEEDKAVDEMMESGAIGAFFGAGGGAINDAAFQALFKHMVRHGYRKQESE